MSNREKINAKRKETVAPAPYSGEYSETPEQGLDDEVEQGSNKTINIDGNEAINLSSDIDSNTNILEDSINPIVLDNEIAIPKESSISNEQDMSNAVLQAIETLKSLGLSIVQSPSNFVSIPQEIVQDKPEESIREIVKDEVVPILPTWKQKRDNTVAKGMRIGAYPATLLRIASSIEGRSQQSIVEDLIVKGLEPLYRHFVDDKS